MSKATYVGLTLLVTVLGCGCKDRSDERSRATADPDPGAASRAATPGASGPPGTAGRAGIQALPPDSITWQGHDLEDSPIGFDAVSGFAVQAGKHGESYYANQHAGPIALTVRYGKNITLSALQEYWKRDGNFRPGPVETARVCGAPAKRQVTTRQEIVLDPSKLLHSQQLAGKLGHAEFGGSTATPPARSSPAPRDEPPTTAESADAPPDPAPATAGAEKRIIPGRTVTVIAAEHAGQTLVATWTLPTALRDRYAAAEAHFLASLRCR